MYRDRRSMNWAFDDIVILHLQTLYHMKIKDWQAAYASQTNVIFLVFRI